MEDMEIPARIARMLLDQDEELRRLRVRVAELEAECGAAFSRGVEAAAKFVEREHDRWAREAREIGRDEGTSGSDWEFEAVGYEERGEDLAADIRRITPERGARGPQHRPPTRTAADFGSPADAGPPPVAVGP